MILTVLGCGDAFGNGGRHNTSFLLSEKNEHLLLDCGASTLVKLKEREIPLEDVSTIVLSHFHGDHFGGVPFILISSLFEWKRERKLTIVGPLGVKERVFTLQEAMYPGTTERLEALDLEFVEYRSKEEIQVGEVRLTAYPVQHSELSIPHGVRVLWREKVIAFSGDTSWTDELIPLCEGADLFICDCNFLNGQAYGHLSYKELLEKREALVCDKIWLSHMNQEVIESDNIVFNRLADGMTLTI